MPESLDLEWKDSVQRLPKVKPVSSIVTLAESSVTQVLNHPDSQLAQEQCTVNPSSMAYFFEKK